MTAFCKDCKHGFLTHIWVSKGTDKKYIIDWANTKCLSPRNYDDPDLVSGEPVFFYETAGEARRGRCGDEAAWFEEKE